MARNDIYIFRRGNQGPQPKLYQIGLTIRRGTPKLLMSASEMALARSHPANQHTGDRAAVKQSSR